MRFVTWFNLLATSGSVIWVQMSRVARNVVVSCGAGTNQGWYHNGGVQDTAIESSNGFAGEQRLRRLGKVELLHDLE
jgi:hypothetical protein